MPKYCWFWNKQIFFSLMRWELWSSAVEVQDGSKAPIPMLSNLHGHSRNKSSLKNNELNSVILLEFNLAIGEVSSRLSYKFKKIICNQVRQLTFVLHNIWEILLPCSCKSNIASITKNSPGNSTPQNKKTFQGKKKKVSSLYHKFESKYKPNHRA